MECISSILLVLAVILIVDIVLYTPVIIVLAIPAIPGFVKYLADINYKLISSLPSRWQTFLLIAEFSALTISLVYLIYLIFGADLPFALSCAFLLWYFRRSIKAFLDNLPE